MKFADLHKSKYFRDMSNDSVESYGVDMGMREQGYKVLLYGELENEVWEINDDHFLGKVVIKFYSGDDTVSYNLDDDIPLSVVRVTVEQIESSI